MIVVFDIGNTTINCGVFGEKKLDRSWKIKTDREKTSEEYSVTLINLFQLASISPGIVRGCIISSVVPPLTPVIEETAKILFKINPLIVGPGVKTGLSVLYDNPHEVGADRVVASVAAFEKYGGPVVVVDFGTATTFDVVSSKGEYLGGAIAPGIQISAEALYLRTAKLPQIEIKKPARAIGKTTVASMQSGIYFGYLGLVAGIIEEIEKEVGARVLVVATGGYGQWLWQDAGRIDFYEPNLVLEGLKMIYDRNKGLG